VNFSIVYQKPSKNVNYNFVISGTLRASKPGIRSTPALRRELLECRGPLREALAPKEPREEKPFIKLNRAFSAGVFGFDQSRGDTLKLVVNCAFGGNRQGTGTLRLPEWRWGQCTPSFHPSRPGWNGHHGDFLTRCENRNRFAA
jgi:hypothetical protein